MIELNGLKAAAIHVQNIYAQFSLNNNLFQIFLYSTLWEVKLARIPLVALFDTDNTLDGIDLAIPANNCGKKALDVAFKLLARQILSELGKISSEDEFVYTLEEFTSKIVPMYRQE